MNRIRQIRAGSGRVAPGRRRVAGAAFALIAIGAILAACASGGTGSEYAPAGADVRSVADQKAAAAAPSAAANGGAASGDAQYASIQQQIVKTGEVTLQVANVANATSRVRAMTVELGGYVGGAQAGTLQDAATLTLRIPAARFDDALSRLHEIGDKVLVEATREEDVTSSVVDLNARLQNLASSEAQYRTLMTKATKIEDILAIQSRLDDVQGQIEQLTAQLKQLTNQASLATLTVTLQPQAEPIQAASSGWDPGATLSAAVGALLSFGQGLVTVGIWLAIVGLPIVLVLTILVLVLLRTGLLRRTPAQTHVPEA